MNNTLSPSEQQAFHHAAQVGDLAAIRDMLAIHPDVFIQDEDHFTPLMHAAAAGHLPVVRALLTPCLHHPEAPWMVQHAFEVAAEKGQVDVARLLIDIGADPDWAFIGMQDYWERCPVCYQRCCPGARKVCDHWLCSSDTIGFTWFQDETQNFEEDVHELMACVHHLAEHGQLQHLLGECPQVLRDMLDRVQQLGPLYWTCDSRVATINWFSRNPLLDHGKHFYTTDPHLAVEVAATARKAVDWLQQRADAS